MQHSSLNFVRFIMKQQQDHPTNTSDLENKTRVPNSIYMYVTNQLTIYNAENESIQWDSELDLPCTDVQRINKQRKPILSHRKPSNALKMFSLETLLILHKIQNPFISIPCSTYNDLVHACHLPVKYSFWARRMWKLKTQRGRLVWETISSFHFLFFF